LLCGISQWLNSNLEKDWLFKIQRRSSMAW
jgi:hypothetical protein